MEWEKCVVKLSIKSKDIDFNHPLNTFNTESSSGTGFFIKNNLILTNYHVVKYSINIEAIYKQTNNIQCKVKHIFPDDDLAIVELEKSVEDCIVLDFKVINTRQIGDVLTIGFPLSSTNIKVTKGIISGYQGSLIQTDASINPGNSGGPLILHEKDKFYIIGVNVSKLVGNAEGTSYVVPIYRFIILQKYIEMNPKRVVVKKPKMFFDFQKLIQEKLRNITFRNHKKLLDNNIGVKITRINASYYLNKHFKPEEVLVSINSYPIDLYGTIKFDFYPEKIPLDEIGLWFIIGDTIKVEVLNPTTQELRTENINLQIIKTNFMDFYGLDTYPSYFVSNNGLILSVVTKEHLKILANGDLNIPVKHGNNIFSNFFNQRNIFTVYLADLEYSKLGKFIKYPLGEIITEINDTIFTTYDEFIKLAKGTINKIKTFDNKIYYLESKEKPKDKPNIKELAKLSNPTIQEIVTTPKETQYVVDYEIIISK
jgi:hypothetical protein